MLKQKLEKIKSLGSNMESTSWRQYDSLMGIKPMLISKKISANGISGNERPIARCTCTWARTFGDEISTISKNKLGEVKI